MNQKRKRLGLWILFLAALLLTQFTVPVKASEPQIQDVNIQMVGGQIRTIDPMGLRMVACIKKSYIQELEKSGATVSYGIVLLPKKYLTEGQALTLDGKYLYNGSVYKPAKVPAVKKFSEDNERIYFTAVLANLPKERYKNDYAARAYAEITRTVTEDDGKKKTTTERKMQADRRSAPSPCLDWNCQKEMKAVRLQGSISLNRENYRNNW